VIGEILGNRYKLLRELGAGGMAWVYLAKDLRENTQVAVKVLYPQFNRDMSYVERFIREAKLATQVSSEHIVRILDYGADRDVHYLVMENIQGEDLATILRRRGKLPWKNALKVAAQVALALDAASAHGIVHRDIKPQNIMITRSGDAKVLDFGIARAHALPTLTLTGFVGSPYYISPEQAMGKRVDIRSDIYSLGIALYESLSGELPFTASSPWSIISQHIAQEPPRLRLSDGRLPKAVEAVVNRMLAKDPDDRYQTPSELLAAIEAALRGPVARESHPQRADQMRDTVHLNKAHELLLSSLYERAMEAAEAQQWPQAVNLFTQIIKLDPDYKDASTQLALAGLRARLTALYSAAQLALEAERWQEAIDELTEIASVEPAYRDASALLAQAQDSLARAQAEEQLAQLYQSALRHYDNKEWREAQMLLQEILETDANYRDAMHLYPQAQRRARWSASLLGRTTHTLSSWVSGLGQTQMAETDPSSPDPDDVEKGV
jgi:serine/threonine protein kinase